MRTLVCVWEGIVGIRLGFDDFVCGEQVVVLWVSFISWDLSGAFYRGVIYTRHGDESDFWHFAVGDVLVSSGSGT
jgi:hypothetical protein